MWGLFFVVMLVFFVCYFTLDNCFSVCMAVNWCNVLKYCSRLLFWFLEIPTPVCELIFVINVNILLEKVVPHRTHPQAVKRKSFYNLLINSNQNEHIDCNLHGLPLFATIFMSLFFHVQSAKWILYLYEWEGWILYCKIHGSICSSTKHMIVILNVCLKTRKKGQRNITPMRMWELKLGDTLAFLSVRMGSKDENSGSYARPQNVT